MNFGRRIREFCFILLSNVKVLGSGFSAVKYVCFVDFALGLICFCWELRHFLEIGW